MPPNPGVTKFSGGLYGTCGREGELLPSRSPGQASAWLIQRSDQRLGGSLALAGLAPENLVTPPNPVSLLSSESPLFATPRAFYIETQGREDGSIGAKWDHIEIALALLNICFSPR